ncbi:unnamed protein product [Angiostrongylus costaricensis]|uniref:Helicase C-terminal domain-containing protein n=1 Tax=Angiostrongylus costaricensis TaxID=334426 RepID=A0A0R3PXF7_ANGCS|nr:unnamed protein product [Angiostrongylus costaricensis]
MVREMITEEEVEQKIGGNKKTAAMLLPARNVFIGSNSVSNPSTKIGKMGCMLVMLLRLRQACIHFHLTKNAVNTEAFQSIGTEYQLTAEEQEQLANITIDSYVDSTSFEDLSLIFRRKHASAKGVVIDASVMVSQWTSFLKILEKHIVKRFRDAQCSTISGDVHPSERQDRVKCFNEDKKGTNVMLVSISAGGVGLNLTGGNHLILMDLHWNPALELQACDRVHRMGQTREVHIHKLIMKQSIEERVLALQMKKMELAENVLKGLLVVIFSRAVSKRNMNLTMADLKFLFDLESHH